MTETKSLNDIRPEFERLMRKGATIYSIKTNEDGEYEQAGTFHMWTGFCLAAEAFGVVKPYPEGFGDDYYAQINSHVKENVY